MTDWIWSASGSVLTALSNPAWVAVVASGLATLISTASFCFVIIDRRQRARGDDPAAEVTISPMQGQDGWWRMTVTVRNYWRTSLMLERLAILRPRGPLLISNQTLWEGTGGKPNQPDVTRASREIASPMTLEPAERSVESPIRQLNRSDHGSFVCFLYLPAEAALAAVDMRLTSRRKARRDQTVLIPIHAKVPPRAPRASR